MLLSAFLIFFTFLISPPFIYYLWMKSKESLAWGLKTSEEYRPQVSLVVATYNEASVIRYKLERIQKIDYPEDKLDVIVVDSNSNDGTLEACRSYLSSVKFRFPIQLISEDERLGKSHALNTALRYARGELIATSDADSFWEPDALLKAVSFFSDPSVGAVTGRECLTNLDKNVHTQSEGLYRKFYYTLRLGESKIHSTLIFQGELSVYRRAVFDKFEDKSGCSDDTGTVIQIVSKGYRCLFVPESIFYDNAAFSLEGRLMLKSRRAQHLIAGVMKSVQLKLKRSLPVPLSVILFNFYFHVVAPFLLLSTLALFVATIAFNFSTLWFLSLLPLAVLLSKRLRVFVVSYFSGNLALIIGLVQHLGPKHTASWRKIDEMRLDVSSNCK